MSLKHSIIDKVIELVDPMTTEDVSRISDEISSLFDVTVKEPKNIDRVSQISFDLAVPTDVTPEQVRKFAEMLQKYINDGNEFGVYCLNGCNDVSDITGFYPMDEVKNIFK
jgi:hypothetical protein